MKKVYVDTAKNIFYHLFDRRVSAKGAHNADRKKQKKRKPFDFRFSYPSGGVMYWGLYA